MNYSIIKSKNSDYTISLIANGVGFFLLTSLLFVIAYVAIFLVNYKYAFLGAWIAISILLIIGAISHYRKWSDEREIISCPWDINSIGAYVASRETLKVIGPAFIINELVMSGVACLFKVFSQIRYKRMIKRFSGVAYVEAVKKLRESARRQQRFVVPGTLNVEFDVIKELILCGVVWVKNDEKLGVLIGLNRAFDQGEE